MASKSKTVNWAGLDLVVNRIITGKTKRGDGELSFSTTQGAVVGRRNVIDITAATRTLTANESGSLVLLNKADGITITLPAASAALVGTWYEFQINTSITSSAAKWSTGTQGTDFFNGDFVGMDSDGTVTSGVAFAGNGSTHDNISMNGSTTGGLKGTQFKVTCISSTLWTVTGYMVGSGTIATPFATT